MYGMSFFCLLNSVVVSLASSLSLNAIEFLELYTVFVYVCWLFLMSLPVCVAVRSLKLFVVLYESLCSKSSSTSFLIVGQLTMLFANLTAFWARLKSPINSVTLLFEIPRLGRSSIFVIRVCCKDSILEAVEIEKCRQC